MHRKREIIQIIKITFKTLNNLQSHLLIDRYSFGPVYMSSSDECDSVCCAQQRPVQKTIVVFDQNLDKNSKIIYKIKPY
jgi:hypothetical protein